MPVYRTGQAFGFSDSRTRRVVAVDGDTVSWSNGPGNLYLMSANFVVPLLRRESSSSIYSHRTFGRPNDLWPLRVGKAVRFRVARKVERKAGDERKVRTYEWACEVGGTNKVTVPAGTYDTYRIECIRSSGRRETPDRRVTWYYAPEIGHYVRRDKERLSSRKTSTIELVSVKGRKRAAARSAVARAPAAPARGQPAKASAGHYAVHLASYSSATGAERGWAALKARFPTLLSGKHLKVENADLGERGVYQRVLAAPFGSRAEAAALCSRIKAEAAQQFCQVTQG